ncbi:Ornithine decarboxylase [Entomophthora muscae]|uniref:Ornithine decarboxylase n=1 Tax=Entomophthora muscae TaxID=34485 RepID=A0ACC2UDE0_9FUNG|nr:Ornithine decarboxylase [Entomophthora muscae]
MLTISNVAKDHVKQSAIPKRILESGQEEPFFIADLGEVKSLLEQWHKELPSITPFYAVKCNPDPMVVSTLAQGGAGFDCASKAEIELALSLGIPPHSIIFANPCKPETHIRFAKEVGVTRMTFDNSAEISKIAHIFPEAELVLRIATDDSMSSYQLSNKYGVPLEYAKGLLETARDLKINVIGVAFHVGSGCGDANAYHGAIRDAATVLAMATELGFSPSLLDIGGGFNGHNSKLGTFSQFAKVIRDSITLYLQDFPGIEIISEPGRYFVTSAFTLATRVCSKRDIRNNKAMYYINDGIYGSFNCVYFDHYTPVYELLRVSNNALVPVASRDTIPSCVWGPTCDVIDIILEDTPLPELFIGDWFIFENMGAYTNSSSTRFNGFSPPDVYYIKE